MRDGLSEFLKELHVVTTREIVVGFGGIELFSPSDIEHVQLGYSRSPGGEDLCGNRAGDWRRSWVVFGHETLCGDPLFVDTDQPQFPVYTAMHGAGSWEPDLVADSFAAFAAIVQETARLSSGRADSDLEDHPLSSSERKLLTTTLSRLNKKAEPDFWLGLFGVE
jgi:hypothetical protein